MSVPKEKVIDDSSFFHKETPAHNQSEDEGDLSEEEEAMSSSTGGVPLALSAKEAEGQNAALNEENTIHSNEAVEKGTDDDDDYVIVEDVEDAEEDDFVKV